MKNKALLLFILIGLLATGVWLYLGKPFPKAVSKQNYEGNPLVMTQEQRKDYETSKAHTNDCANQSDLYIKLKNNVFRFPLGLKVTAKYGDNYVYHKCKTSLSNPLQADTLKLGIPFNLKSNEGRFGFKVQIKSSEIQKFKPYDDVQSALASQDKALKDLELVEGFYKYIKPSENLNISEDTRTQYISADTALKSDRGVPLVLQGCRNEKSALLCSSYSELDENLFMTTSASGSVGQMSSEIPIAAWTEIYPQIMQKINSYRVSEER